jgi:hypothetical protein
MARSILPSMRDLRGWLREAEQALDRGIDEVEAWLATPTGRRVRALAAQLLIVSAPMMLRHPFFRTPAGRLVQIAGGAALLVRLAEAIRDWEPEPTGPARA